MSDELTTAAIAQNIRLIKLLLEEASGMAATADNAIERGQRNEAIGSMPGFGETLEQALALYRAAIALHRTGAGRWP